MDGEKSACADGEERRDDRLDRGNREKTGEKCASSTEQEQQQSEDDAMLGKACREGDVELTRQLLLSGCDVCPDEKGWWPIHEAAHGLHLECCKALVEIGKCDMDILTADLASPLLLVCQSKSRYNKAVEVAQYLLNCGADLSARAGRDPTLSTTPLIEAIKSRNRELARLLITRGANPNEQGGEWFALHVAAAVKDLDLMRLLISSHADLFIALPISGATSLMIAVGQSFLYGVKLLLEAAKETNRATELADKAADSGLTCVMEASLNGNADILQTLINYGANCNKLYLNSPFNNKDIHAISMTASPECLELLLPHVDREVLKGTVDPVIVAAQYKLSRNMQLLINAGFSLENATDIFHIPTFNLLEGLNPYFALLLWRNKETALNIAVRNDDVLMIRMLISAGAQMICEGVCMSPFWTAIRNDNHTHLTILREFLWNNVDINANSGRYPYYIPDALLSIFNTSNAQQKLLSLLECGLDPSLKFWCKCKRYRSLLEDAMRYWNREDVLRVLKILVKFSPGIPSCCDQVAEVLDAKPEVPSLMHLCRLAVRKPFQTSQLYGGRFTENLPVPKLLKDYLAFRECLTIPANLQS